MHNFTRNLITEWRKLNLAFADETFVVAVSGGADSISLTLALSELRESGKLRNRFVVAHYNHNLRGEASGADENYVREFAGKFNFELACGIQKPKSELRNQTGNLEQNARVSRYEFLFETARKLDACAVLTAHTLNDQAETLLMNLIRGSGLDGLGGMKPISSAEWKAKSEASEETSEIQSAKTKIKLIRPLLNWARRDDTENFCLLNEEEFRRDAMNEDLKYNRVRIRTILLPLLADFNPKILETLARTSNLLRESAELLAMGNQPPENTSADKPETKTENQKPKLDSELIIKDLKDVFPTMRRAILRGWLKENRGNTRGLELKHIEAVENLIFSRKSGRTIELPNGETVLKKGGVLYFKKTKVEK